MIDLSEEAAREVAEFFAQSPDEPRTIRLFISPGACSGPALNMALDQVDEDDVTVEKDGVTFCMTKALAERVGNVRISLDGENFVIRCERPVVDPTVFSSCSCCSGGCGESGEGGCCGC
ncbi:MAG: IscA/HesB family protein [Desulfovibrionaceae bacterium]|nr:IscA/HesB family protein [Desulfovibrionaceae bacterium]